MRVLVGCEMSGVVRRAFRDLGHEAYSCDLEPAADGSLYHIQGDVLSVIGQDWDLGIFHPPCTYLCNSGVRWLSNGHKLNHERHELMKAGCDLFAKLLACEIPRICVENPVMHKFARDYLEQTWRVTRHDARPTQSIQPWQFGHGETKRTCLWLKNLPPLMPTNIVEGREQRIWKMGPTKNKVDRARLRSVTYEGVGRAMAEQWGNL